MDVGNHNDLTQVMELTLNTLQMIAFRDAAVSDEREKTESVFQARIQMLSQALAEVAGENGQVKKALVESEGRYQQLLTLSEEQNQAYQLQIKTAQEESEKLRNENEKLMKLLDIANQQPLSKPIKRRKSECM